MYVRTVFASILLGLLLSNCTQQLETRQASPLAQNATPFRVMSFNIRYNNPGDEAHAWPHRVDRVASTILFNNTDIVGVQEALKEQLDDLSAKLPGYAWIGVGRDDGAEAGEYTAIFYNEDRFALLDEDTFWLSKTPEIPGSKDWDAALTRIATWGHFEDTLTGALLYVFNTHFDHRGAEARTQSASLIAARATEIAGDTPLVVTGDFNFTPAADGYAALTDKLSDAFHTTIQPHHGPASTIYRGFEVTHEPGRRIDYIFTNDALKVHQHATLSDNWEGAFASDHLAVIATLAVNN